jgi:acyl-CoA synthetase (AMP-forming)/AMP-acid ligase II
VTGLAERSAVALARPPADPAVAFDGRIYSWGELGHVADCVRQLIEDSGIDADIAVAFLPRNRPSAAAALLGLVRDRRTIRLLDPQRPPDGMVHAVAQLRPAVMIAAADDYTPQMLALLWEVGIAAIALNEEPDAFGIPGRETSLVKGECGADPPRIEIETAGQPLQMLPHDHLAALIAARPHGTPQAPVALSQPLAGAAGIADALAALLNGDPAVLLDPPSA